MTDEQQARTWTALEKERCRRATRAAVKNGLLIKPDTCQDCGKNPGLDKIGRTNLHAHHAFGYDKPLEVEWLCYLCHCAHDPRPKGSANGQSKLTWQAADLIRSSSEFSRHLAARFGVSTRTIRNVRNGTHWQEECNV